MVVLQRITLGAPGFHQTCRPQIKTPLCELCSSALLLSLPRVACFCYKVDQSIQKVVFTGPATSGTGRGPTNRGQVAESEAGVAAAAVVFPGSLPWPPRAPVGSVGL